jgi:hypothetical protein
LGLGLGKGRDFLVFPMDIACIDADGSFWARDNACSIAVCFCKKAEIGGCVVKYDINFFATI